MPNIDMVMTKLAKGLTTGAGVFASTFVGDLIDDSVPGGDLGTALGQMAVGAGVAVGAERISGRAVDQRDFSVNTALVETGVEHFGYGIHGAGFAELADKIQTGASSRERMVSVSARSDGVQTGQEVSVREVSEPVNREFSLDTA